MEDRGCKPVNGFWRKMCYANHDQVAFSVYKDNGEFNGTNVEREKKKPSSQFMAETLCGWSVVR